MSRHEPSSVKWRSMPATSLVSNADWIESHQAWAMSAGELLRSLVVVGATTDST